MAPSGGRLAAEQWQSVVHSQMPSSGATSGSHDTAWKQHRAVQNGRGNMKQQPNIKVMGYCCGMTQRGNSTVPCKTGSKETGVLLSTPVFTLIPNFLITCKYSQILVLVKGNQALLIHLQFEFEHVYGFLRKKRKK